MGLAIKGLNYTALYYRLRLIYYAYNHLSTIKIDPTIYSQFRKAYKPLVLFNSLELYKFIYNLVLRFSYNRETLLNQIIILNNQEVWQQEGSIVLNIFKQQWDFSILAIINKEIYIYYYYQYLINRQPNYSQLRIMVYSLCQQLIRQDPQYYCLYYALRPNSQWRLISYPYYTKFAIKGDSTAFRHININIPLLLKSGYSTNII